MTDKQIYFLNSIKFYFPVLFSSCNKHAMRYQMKFQHLTWAPRPPRIISSPFFTLTPSLPCCRSLSSSQSSCPLSCSPSPCSVCSPLSLWSSPAFWGLRFNARPKKCPHCTFVEGLHKAIFSA